MAIIKSAKELVNNAVKQLLKYQSGEDTPVKTRYQHFNENLLGGIFKNMMIIIAGISGSGKTYVLQQIEQDFLDKNLNTDADDYILLRCNWEMTVFRLLLRRLSKGLKKSMKYILFNKPDDESLIKFKEITNKERSSNIFYLEEPTTPGVWYENVKAFLEQHKKSKHILITVDHIALVRDNGNKKKAMDELVEYANSLKKEYKNVSFILISQLNRDIENRVDPRFAPPKRSDLYNSDTMFHIGDLVLVIHNPFRLGIHKYMVVRPKDYPYLQDYMYSTDTKTTNFITENVIFWHYLKIREIDDMEDLKNLYIENIMDDEKYKEYVAKKRQAEQSLGNDPDYEFTDDTPF